MTLVSSVLYVSPVATVELARNRARGLGGAIFISKPRPRYACDTLTATASTCYNVIIKNCTISNIRQGAVVVNETRSLVVDTFITNSSTGIISNDGDVEMMNVVVTGCAASSLQDGSLVVRGMLGMHHSSFQVYKKNNSQVIFQRAPQSSGLSLTGFSATDRQPMEE